MKISAKKIISVALLVAATSSFAGVISNATSQNKSIAEQIKALNLRFEANNKLIIESKPRLESALRDYAGTKSALTMESNKLAELKKQYELTYMRLKSYNTAKSYITAGTTTSTSPTISQVDISNNPNLIAIKKNMDISQARVIELTNSLNKLSSFINSIQ